ncbi:MAG: P-loop NTPase [Fimbriimonadaceae bacterium]
MSNSNPKDTTEGGHALAINTSLLGCVPAKVAHANRALPIGLEDEVLVCAVPKSADPDLGTRLTMELGRPVRVQYVYMKDLRPLLLKAYPEDPTPEAMDVVESIAAPAQKTIKPMVEKERPNEQPIRGSLHGKVIAVTSGKGGVGKSNVAVNLGIALTRLGFRVLVIDCDFGLSNVHVLMGLKPSYRLPHVLSGQVTLNDALCTGPDGIKVLAGVAGSAEISELTYWHLVTNGVNLDELRSCYDYILLDTAAGIQRGMLSLLEAADQTLLVMTPEPSSVQDAYATIRLLFENKPNAKVSVIVNQAKDAKAARNVAAKFQTFLALYLTSRANYLGHVCQDRSVEAASKSRTPFVLLSQRGRASQDVQAIAKTLCGAAAAPGLGAGLLERLMDKIRAA